MKRSNRVTTTFLLASIGALLAGCDDTPVDDVAQAQNDGMLFESYEECALNIGAENCQKKEQVVQNAGASGSHSSFVFIPIMSYHGGYIESAPRLSNPVYSSTPAARAFSSPGSVSTGVSARGGFGATARGGFSSGS